ncbi:4'-phosphopantetheinyl transferase family protein [Pantoea sp. LMR881]|uniref:4'-phosphopantetheinyl transferase family protein n=1 Tax=Pantoea sp. LMR881 TaxID=3014336 RepID=UPI002F35EEC7
MHYPKISLPLPASGFIVSQQLNDSDPLLAISHFSLDHYDDALADAWGLPLPARLQQAVKKRRAEYLASRLLARSVMAEWGFAHFTLHNAADRSPVWPAGVQASLSHSSGTVVLAATRQPLCIGVDVEQFMSASTADETADMLMGAGEQAYLRILPLDFAHAATLLFSLKESLYKALWPVLHQPMDFHQAALIAVDFAQNRATLRLEHGFNAPFQKGVCCRQRF